MPSPTAHRSGRQHHTSGVFYVSTEPGDRKAKHLLELIREVKEDSDLPLISSRWGPN